MRTLIVFALAITVSPVALAAEKHQPPAANANLKPVTLDGITWSGDLAAALDQAAKAKKLVFIDFTGAACVNCKLNEKTVFVKPEVKDLFKQFVRVQLYTDSIPETYYKELPEEAKREKDAEGNQDFQKKVFKKEQLPLYAIVKPAEGGAFEIVGAYDEGRINNLEKFVEFLKKPLKSD